MNSPVGSPQPVVELMEVSKAYGEVEVLGNVTLSLGAGEVVALVGDNGAGKSTLVKIVSGYLRPTSGRLVVGGREVRFASPREARRCGIETVYQDLAIIGQLSLWRNFFLGQEMRRKWLGVRVLDRNAMRRICLERLRDFGLESVRSPDQLAASLSGGAPDPRHRQVGPLRIATADTGRAGGLTFRTGSRLLILDEPVASLSVREVRRVHDTIDQARNRGLGILYIDHNMNHVVPVADRIAVLERGRLKTVVHRGEVSAADLNDLLAREAGAAVSNR